LSTPLLLGAAWVLMLLGGYVWLTRTSLQSVRSARQAIVIIVLVASVARLVPHFLLPMGAGYDIESYQIVADLVLQGKDVYTSPDAVNRHPYLPFQMYWMAFARWGAQAARLPFVKIVRLAPIGADVGIALLLFLSRRQSDSLETAFYGGLLYALNPIPIFVSAYHGQFDAIPALLTMLALYQLKSPWVAGGWLGLGILDKSWPVLALPSLYAAIQGWSKRLRFLGTAALIPMLGIGIYLLFVQGQAWTVIRRALEYNWGVGVWGYTYFFRLLSILDKGLAGPFTWLARYGRWLTLATLGSVWLLKARKELPAAGLLTILATFFAVTHAFSIQYLMWLVPFAILNQQYRWLTRYTLGAFAYMFLVYTTLILGMNITRLLPGPQADWFIIMPAGLPAWLVTVGWAYRRLTGGSLHEPHQQEC
jgi:hypothetical protein